MKNKIALVTFTFLMLTITSTFASSIDELQNSLHKIAENGRSSVVFISTEKTVKQRNFGGTPFEFFFQDRSQNQKEEKEFKQKGLGSGFIFSNKGDEYFILTNNHVVSGSDKITVTIDQNKEYTGTIVGTDPATDVAVVKIKTKDKLGVVKLGDSSRVKQADFVVAIGNPFGLSHSISFGIVSAIGRSSLNADNPGFTNFIQTDTAINQGNSGGPLINMSGEVIGINTMIYSGSGGNIGIGFAIPINVAQQIADQLIKTGKIEHGWLGISFHPLTEETASKLGLDKINSGMLVQKVIQDSPAEKSGIKTGDVILEVDGKKVSQSNDLTMAIGNSKPGSKVNLKILRNNKVLEYTVKLGKRSDLDKQNNEEDNENSSDKLTEDFGFKGESYNDKGVKVKEIFPNTKSSTAGLKKDDIIFKVNNKTITNIKELLSVIEKSESPSYFFIDRNGEIIIITM